MRYETAGAFRTALESRLQRQARDGGMSIVRLRKPIVFDRFLARLMEAAPDRWIVKGGVALALRLGNRARATKDLDLVTLVNPDAVDEDFIAVQAVVMDDFFSFSTRKHTMLVPHEGGAVRYRVLAELDGRRFEEVAIDVGFSEPQGTGADVLPGPDLLTFAGIPRIHIPALPLEMHLAERVHAYTRNYAHNQTSTRVKDLADLILIGSIADFDAARLVRAIDTTFADRGTHGKPTELPPPPSVWRTPYRQLALETGLDPNLAAGYRQARVLLDPLLGGEIPDEHIWDSSLWSWRER